MLQAKIAERGQVTIPKALRETLGLKPGSLLIFTAYHGKLIITKVEAKEPLAKYYGCIKTDKSTDQIMRELRGEE